MFRAMLREKTSRPVVRDTADDVEAVKQALGAPGIDVNAGFGNDNTTPLYNASYHNEVEMVKCCWRGHRRQQGDV